MGHVVKNKVARLYGPRCRINFLLHCVILVPVILLIHFISHLSRHFLLVHHSRHLLLPHSVTPGLKLACFRQQIARLLHALGGADSHS